MNADSAHSKAMHELIIIHLTTDYFKQRSLLHNKKQLVWAEEIHIANHFYSDFDTIMNTHRLVLLLICNDVMGMIWQLSTMVVVPWKIPSQVRCSWHLFMLWHTVTVWCAEIATKNAWMDRTGRVHVGIYSLITQSHACLLHAVEICRSLILDSTSRCL